MKDADLRKIDIMFFFSIFHFKQFYSNTIFSYKMCNIEPFEPFSEYSDTHFSNCCFLFFHDFSFIHDYFETYRLRIEFHGFSHFSNQNSYMTHLHSDLLLSGAKYF